MMGRRISLIITPAGCDVIGVEGAEKAQPLVDAGSSGLTA